MAALNPLLATTIGAPGHEREMPDLSPAGPAAIADLNRRTLAQLDAAPLEQEADRIAREVMVERLRIAVEQYDAREYLRRLGIIGSPLQEVRQVFDLMAKDTETGWSNVAARLALVPNALAGYRQSLSEGLRRKLSASRRQASRAAEQARVWAGLAEADGQPSFFGLLGRDFRQAQPEHGWPASLVRDMDHGARAARDAYAEMRRYLLDEYCPATSEREAAGEDRYVMLARGFLGAGIDPRETYDWGWQELYRIEAEMRATERRIQPGASAAAVRQLLETDPARAVTGVERYRQWLQELHDEALEQLHGRHFEIPSSIRRIEVMIPPPGGALAPHYTRPSEDLTRSGRTWWPTGGNTRFPKWGQLTTVYHEGVPGHHLQVATARLYTDRLSRYQRLLTFVSGHGEGWALYAERLMAELGYLENPDYYLGMLSAQALRAVRVIIDIGLHLELRIPPRDRFHPGEVWNHDLALEFAVERSGRPRQFIDSELVRYLGWPGQAISYKVGERYWLAAREAAKRAGGRAFDLKKFHTDALALGAMGLDQLQREMSASLP